MHESLVSIGKQCPAQVSVMVIRVSRQILHGSPDDDGIWILKFKEKLTLIMFQIYLPVVVSNEVVVVSKGKGVAI